MKIGFLGNKNFRQCQYFLAIRASRCDRHFSISLSSLLKGYGVDEGRAMKAGLALEEMTANLAGSPGLFLYNQAISTTDENP